jgi:hypothetical protein
MARAYNHWSKGPNAEEVKARVLANHWSKSPSAKKIRKRLSRSNSLRVVSPDTCEKHRLAWTGRNHTEEAKQKMRKPKSAKALRNMVAGHHSRKIGKAGYSALIKRSRTPEVVFKIAEGVRKGLSGFKLSKKGYYTDRHGRKFYMRSSWEILVAIWLDRRRYNWEYEPETLALSGGLAYIPDFRLDDGRLLEVKGYLSPKAKEKIVAARSMGYHVVLLDRTFLQRLRVLR